MIQTTFVGGVNPFAIAFSDADYPTLKPIIEKPKKPPTIISQIRSALKQRAMNSDELMMASGLGKRQIQAAINRSKNIQFEVGKPTLYWVSESPPSIEQRNKVNQIYDFILHHPWVSPKDIPEKYGTKKSIWSHTCNLEISGKIESRSNSKGKQYRAVI